MVKAQKILQKARNKELVVGAHVFFAHYEITEAFGFMGYDFVWIDGEHSAFDREKSWRTLSPQIPAAPLPLCGLPGTIQS